MERIRNRYMKYTKEHNYVKTGRNITVPFLFTWSNDDIYIYICTEFHEEIIKGFLSYRADTNHYHLNFDLEM